ncbi:MAG: hypothetical protein OXL41_12025 [Nitrospinae bacterium]|nr:hypothetical protein [Nitrospinota bacterium]
MTIGGQNMGAHADALLPGADRPLTGRALNERTGEDVDAVWRELRMSEVLLASSFHLASAESMEAGARWSAWGRGARSNFEGAADGLALEGEVTTATLGLDFESGAALVGVALALSRGEGSYRAGGSCRSACEVESALTGVYPYLRYQLSERLSLWGALGMGRGDMTIQTRRGAAPVETDIESGMTAAGGRGILLPARMAGGFELALRGDFLLSASRSDAAAGLPEVEADTMRLRLLLEGSRSFRLGAAGVLTPSVEVGYRHERGDAETGSGLEVGGSLRFAAKRLTLEVGARALVKHEESDYEEWGVSGSMRYAPASGGRGLSMSLASAWGADSGGAERLWSQAQGVSARNFDPGARLEAEVGYGLAAYRGLLTPYAGLSHSEGGETWRAGARWSLGPALDLELEASLTEPADGAAPESGVLLRGSRRW